MRAVERVAGAINLDPEVIGLQPLALICQRVLATFDLAAGSLLFLRLVVSLIHFCGTSRKCTSFAGVPHFEVPPMSCHRDTSGNLDNSTHRMATYP